MVKMVVDVQSGMICVGGELHADCEALLLEKGCQQIDVWGINFYPWHKQADRIEYTALINIRPKQENPSMEVLDNNIKQKMKAIVEKIILSPDEKLV